MKKIISFILVILVMSVLVMTFAGCSEAKVSDLAQDIKNATALEVVDNTDYTIKTYGANLTGDKKIYYELNYKSGEHSHAKFTIVDERDITYTNYTTVYYGASVPSNKYMDFWTQFPASWINLEKASEEDYQNWYYDNKTLYYDTNSQQYYSTQKDNAQTGSTYLVKTSFENGWQDFFAMDNVSKCVLSSISQTIAQLSDYCDLENSTVTQKGRVKSYTIKIKDDCPVKVFGQDTASKTISLTFTNGKISYFADAEENFKFNIAYGGAKILMPNYDKAIDNSQILA